MQGEQQYNSVPVVSSSAHRHQHDDIMGGGEEEKWERDSLSISPVHKKEMVGFEYGMSSNHSQSVAGGA